jgi:chorismate mutase
MTQTPNSPEQEHEELARLRHAIEQVDRDLIKLIARRVDLARQVGAVKRTAGMPPEEDVRYLFWHIIGMSRRVQLIEE